jgi:predicted transcriptional regulator
MKVVGKLVADSDPAQDLSSGPLPAGESAPAARSRRTRRAYRAQLLTEGATRRHRTRFEICNDILRTATTGARTTRILYQANLSFATLRRYLDSLVGSGLLLRDVEQGTYHLTKRGRLFLRAYEELRYHRSVIQRMEMSLNKSLQPAVDSSGSASPSP